VKGGCYFFTVALAERRGSLLTENLEGLRAAFREVKQESYQARVCHVGGGLAIFIISSLRAVGHLSK
jgi:REP element-mobilizing transposase RayT